MRRVRSSMARQSPSVSSTPAMYASIPAGDESNPRHRLGSMPWQAQACDLDRARIRRDGAQEHQQRGGLARAVGPKQADTLARRDRQGQIIDRAAAAERLDQMTRADHVAVGPHRTLGWHGANLPVRLGGPHAILASDNGSPGRPRRCGTALSGAVPYPGHAPPRSCRRRVRAAPRPRSPPGAPRTTCPRSPGLRRPPQHPGRRGLCRVRGAPVQHRRVVLHRRTELVGHAHDGGAAQRFIELVERRVGQAGATVRSPSHTTPAAAALSDVTWRHLPSGLSEPEFTSGSLVARLSRPSRKIHRNRSLRFELLPSVTGLAAAGA